MERMSSSVQSWVEDHKLSTVGGVSAAAVGLSVAYSRRKQRAKTSQQQQRLTIQAPRKMHAAAKSLTLVAAVLGGAAFVTRCYYHSSKSSAEKLDLDFYSQLPPATDADGNENERWSW